MSATKSGGGAPDPAVIRPGREQFDGNGSLLTLSATVNSPSLPWVRYTYPVLSTWTASVRAVCSHGCRRRSPIKYWCSL